MTKKLSICVLLLLAGCEPVTRTSSPETVGGIATNITYFRDDQHGICFAMLQSASYGFYNVVSITTVPCEKVGL